LSPSAPPCLCPWPLGRKASVRRWIVDALALGRVERGYRWRGGLRTFGGGGGGGSSFPIGGGDPRLPSALAWARGPPAPPVSPPLHSGAAPPSLPVPGGAGARPPVSCVCMSIRV
jgi:hypothetical protein